MGGAPCPFCTMPSHRHFKAGERCYAIHDAYPVSPGHTLILPRRHVASFFDTLPEERAELLSLLDACRQELMASHAPSGFNIGINDGKDAGQTVMHLHIHLIPRYAGDKDDPRGGIRWLFPDKADYWTGR